MSRPLDAGMRLAVKSRLAWSRRRLNQEQAPSGSVTGVTADDAVPFIVTSFVPEDHIVRNGFPYLPPIWVRASGMVSMEGAVYDEATDPWSINWSDAHSRFLFNDALWDDISGVLNPFQSEGIDYYFTSDVASQPRLETIEYQVGKKVKVLSSLRFDEGDSLTSSFNSGNDDASVLTLCVVGRVYGTERACFFRIGNEPSETIEFYTGENFLIRNGVAETIIDTVVAPGAMTPLIVILTSTPDRTLVTISFLGRLHQKYIHNVDVTRNLSLTFGENLLGTKKLTANLFDIVLFDREIQHADIASRMRMIYE